MKNTLKVSLSEKPKTDGYVAVRTVSVREHVLRFLLGETRRVVVLIPGDRLGELTIEDVKEN